MDYKQLIFDTALADGMPEAFARLIAAQAAHETGNFTSNAFLKNKNCFGYKYVKGGKWQAGAGITSTEHDPYAKYDSIENSVHELTDWVKRRQKEKKFPPDLSTVDTPVEYATLLKACGYYGAPVQEYITGLTHGLAGMA
jgi:uncharacterized FlgJ-related protein